MTNITQITAFQNFKVLKTCLNLFEVVSKLKFKLRMVTNVKVSKFELKTTRNKIRHLYPSHKYNVRKMKNAFDVSYDLGRVKSTVVKKIFRPLPIEY